MTGSPEPCSFWRFRILVLECLGKLQLQILCCVIISVSLSCCLFFGSTIQTVTVQLYRAVLLVLSVQETCKILSDRATS